MKDAALHNLSVMEVIAEASLCDMLCIIETSLHDIFCIAKRQSPWHYKILGEFYLRGKKNTPTTFKNFETLLDSPFNNPKHTSTHKL